MCPRDRTVRGKGCEEKILPEGSMTEGGDFFEAGRKPLPLRLAVPHARNFGIMFKILSLIYGTDGTLGALVVLCISRAVMGRTKRFAE